MATIVDSIEIARTPEVVFAYIDFERFGEWQDNIVSVQRETEGPTRVGSRATVSRKTPTGPQPVTLEITEYDPPRRISVRGTSGPIRTAWTVTIELAGDGRSQITTKLDVVGHRLGKLLAPLAQRQARGDVPRQNQKLKERLESGTWTP